MNPARFGKLVFKHRLLLVVIFAAALLRFPFLDRLPIGISDDELMYIADAKAIWYTGRNMTNAWAWFAPFANPQEYPHTELPHLILAPVIGPLPFSLANAHLPFAVLGIVLVVSLYFFTKKFFGQEIAFFVGLAAALNPWNIFFSRNSFDASLTIPFFMLALALTAYLKGKSILFLTIPLLLGLGCYLGVKIIYVPFLAALLLFGWIFACKRKDGKYFLIVAFICLAPFILYLVSFRTLSVSARSWELFTPSSETISSIVNDERRQAIATPLTTILVNKYTIFLRLAIEKYFKVFSPNILFTNGDFRATFSLYRHGYFYILDALFIIIGFLFVFRKNRGLFWFLAFLLAVSPCIAVASQAQNGFSGVRGLFLYQILVLFTGIGLGATFLWLNGVSWGKLGKLAILCSYIILVANFIHTYAFQYPVYSSEAYSASSRILSRYLTFALGGNKKVVVFTTSPKEKFIYFLFHGNFYTKDNAKALQQEFTNKSYSYRTVRFVHCLTDQPMEEGTAYIAESGGCDKLTTILSQPKRTIPILADGGGVYSIIKDSVCPDIPLKRYPHDIRFSDLSMEKLTRERFCQTYITEIGL